MWGVREEYRLQESDTIIKREEDMQSALGMRSFTLKGINEKQIAHTRGDDVLLYCIIYRLIWADTPHAIHAMEGIDTYVPL